MRVARDASTAAIKNPRKSCAACFTKVSLIDCRRTDELKQHEGRLRLPDNATWRLAWEPRVLSILRVMVGLLYMEHGLNKLFDFPPTPTHMPYRLFSLVPAWPDHWSYSAGC